MFLLTACQHPPVVVPAVVVAEHFNQAEQISKPTVVMISIDGFRHDYLKIYKPPNLRAWAHDGVQADGLIPSFPSLTFPNHVTLVTGLKPGHHGIVNNRFYDEKRQAFYSIGDNKTVNDGSWYRGTPLWTAAEKEGMLSATAFWVGAEAKIGGVDPSYFKTYDEKVPNADRVKWVTDWLTLPENKKPHFIALYFSDVDTMGHRFGPISEEVKNAVLDIDTQLGVLRNFIADKKLDVQIVVVSDHGMKNITRTVDLSQVESIKNFKSTGRGAVVSFYSNDAAELANAYRDIKKIKGPFKIYNASEYPKRWQLDDVDRRGEITVVGEPGVYIAFEDGSGKKVGKKSVAGHGWETDKTTEMNGLFIASGSKFKKGLRIRAFDNIHVQPLVKSVLELKNQEAVDGNLKFLKSILLLK